MKDSSTQRALTAGFLLLAVFVPVGLTLEALHALKVDVYLSSSTRREMWTLAHAHGNLLGLLLLAYGALASDWFDEARRRAIARWLVPGAILMPLGFFAGGVLNAEGDPSLGIALVPIGGVCVLIALVGAARGIRG